MSGAQDPHGAPGGAPADEPVSRLAAADVAQVIRGKRWLQRVVEMAESVTGRPVTGADAADPGAAPRAS
ncbi:hypothetical protein [Pseudonocardia thermophila]|nr:hypothetical protein [Pseudonocardia thermophila]